MLNLKDTPETAADIFGCSVESRFRSRKQTLNQKVVFVYCPESEMEKILSIAKNCDFKVIINDFSLKDLSRKVICHYKSGALNFEQKKFLIDATELGAWVEPLVSYLDSRLGYTEVQLLHSGYFLHQKAFSILSIKRTQIVKRIVDLLMAIILFLITLPILIITAVLIKLESKGPIFYRQLRTGQYNEQFKVIKFRSMTIDAEANGAQWAVKNDCRVTKVGRFIRRTRIDELPQILNIIRGEMSIVGPRPEREMFIEKLEAVIPYYRFRHAVKPGVTGLAQVNYAYGASIEDAIWKHKYDIYYIKYHSTLLDFKILFKTIKTVLFGMGR